MTRSRPTPGRARPTSAPARPSRVGRSAGGARRRRSNGADFRARVRMYRHGLGDCFLVTFRRADGEPFHLLVDCGALARSATDMVSLAERIEEATRRADGRSRLDLVIATHEHRDHLSGFNQAREVFERIEIGAVWMGWTENPEDLDARRLLEGRKRALASLRAALASPRGMAAAAAGALDGVDSLLAFGAGDDTALDARKTIADAIGYLRGRGERAGALEFLAPGNGPLQLDGVESVRAFVLGPPRDTRLLLDSAVTKKRLEEGSIYHLAGLERAALDALGDALGFDSSGDPVLTAGRHRPFPSEHSIRRDGFWFDQIAEFVAQTYDNEDEAWRHIDHDWIESFGRLALKLDNDTNNTSLVVAFELEESGDVLLFVGDAQVGNWLSWGTVEFPLPERAQPLQALDLVRRTVFYKVGHHASHNATLKKGGLELMESDRLVAFIPLDRATAAAQGRKDPATGQPKGWDMPAGPLYEALKQRAADRVVISDAAEQLPQAAISAGIEATPEWIDWYYR